MPHGAEGTPGAFAWMDGVEASIAACPTAVVVVGAGIDASGTTDSTTAIQAKLDAGAGHSVYFPAGTYKFTNLYPAAGTVVYGAGRGATILAPVCNNTTDQNRIHIDSVANVTLRDFTIGETGVTTRSGSYGPISGNGSTGILIQNVEVTASSATGMHFWHCVDVLIDGCHIHHTKADGLHFQRGSADVRVSNCLIEYVEDDCIGFVSHGFDIYGYCRNLTVTNCVLGRNPTALPGSGVALIGIIGATITGNIIVDTPFSGIRVTEFFGSGEGDAVGGNITITGNTIINSGIYTGGTSGVVKDGITVNNQRNVVITGNLIDKAVGNGVDVGQAGINVVVSDNTITRAALRGIIVGALEQVGNYLRLWTETLLSDGTTLAYVNMHQIVVQDNVIRSPGIDGLNLVGVAAHSMNECKVTGNVVYLANASNTGTAYGISLSYITNSVVSGNHVGAAYAGNALVPFNIGFTTSTVLTANNPELYNNNTDGRVCCIYQPATPAVYTITTSDGRLDATHLTATFSATGTGFMLVEATMWADISASTGILGTVWVNGSAWTMQWLANSAVAGVIYLRNRIPITPGLSVTITIGALKTGGTATVTAADNKPFILTVSPCL